MKTRSIFHRVFVVILCFSIFLTNFNGMVFLAGEAAVITPGTTDHIADTSTMDTYIQALDIDKDSRNAGRVWADKSAFTDDIELDNDTDGYNGTIVNDSDFLHAFSTLGSSYEIDQDSIPLDVVFILDFSGSMMEPTDNGRRMPKTLEAVNGAINTIIDKSPNSRIGIVAYSSIAVEIIPLVKLVPEVGKTDTKWFECESLDYFTKGRVWFTGEGLKATDSKTWEAAPDLNKTLKVGDFTTWSDIGLQTNLQAGIALGMNMLAEEEVTEWYSQETEQEYTRTPAVIIMTDGQCNLLCQSNDGEQNNAWWNTNPESQYWEKTDEYESGVEPIVVSTLLTASYNMTRIYKHYYDIDNITDKDSDKHVYAYGISVDTQDGPVAHQKIYSILDSSNYFNSSASGNRIKWAHADLKYAVDNKMDSYLFGYLDDEKEMEDSDYPVTINFANGEGYTHQQLYDNTRYTDAFYDVEGDEQKAIFDKIIKEIINVNMFKPVGGANDVNKNDILTYMDPIGKYMEIKDIKSLLLFGNLYDITKDGGPVYYDKDGKLINNAEDIDNRNYAYFHQNYRIVADNNIAVNPCYSNKDYTEYFDLSDIEIYTKTTWDFRDPDIEDGNIQSDTGADQALYINIPVRAMPIRKVTVNLEADGDIAAYRTNLGDKQQSTPLRVFYTVGVADDVKTSQGGAIDLAKLSPDYVSANKDPETGAVYLYSNWYNGKKENYKHYVTGLDTGYTFGDAVITFSPDPDNKYYRYQDCLPIHDAATGDYITDIDRLGSYYLVTDYYTAGENPEHLYQTVPRMGAEFGSGIGHAAFGEYLCWYNIDENDVQPYLGEHDTPPADGYILAARQGGVCIGDMAPNIGSKEEADNKTITSGTYYMPTISESTIGDILIVNIYLGNNARLCATDTQLLVTKTVSRIGAEDEDLSNEYFDYTIKLSDNMLKGGKYNAIRVTSAGEGNWRSLLSTIELLTNNQGLLLKEGGAIASYKYEDKEYYVYVGGDQEKESFTHTLFDKSRGESLDDILSGNVSAKLTVEAYLVPIDAYDTDWAFNKNDARLIKRDAFEVGDINTNRKIGYEVEIKEYQSLTAYEYMELDFDANGEAKFRLRDGEGILLLGLEPGTDYTVTETISAEQASEDMNILFRSVEHKTPASNIYYGTDDVKEGSDHSFDDAAHEYTVWGKTGTDGRREVNYFNYIPKTEKKIVPSDLQYVNIGDTITYVLYWENYMPDGKSGYKTAQVVIEDKLDEGVKFISAEYVDKVAEDVYQPVRWKPDNWSYAYDENTHTVKWTIPNAPGGSSGYVRLTVEVTDKAVNADKSAYDITNQGKVSVGNKYVINTNEVVTPVGEVHKTEIEVIKTDGEKITVNADNDKNAKPVEGDELKHDDVTGNYVGPLVDQGYKIKYKISFINYKDEPATIDVADRIDPDATFISAEYDGVKLDVNAENVNNPTTGKARDKDVTITYYPDTQTVRWEITNVQPDETDCVYLTIQVTSDSPELKNPEEGGSQGGNQGGGNQGGSGDNSIFPAGEHTFEEYVNDTSILPIGAYIIETHLNNGTVNNAISNVPNSAENPYQLYPKQVNVENKKVTTDDRSVVWLVEYPDVTGNPLYFYLRNAETGEYLCADKGILESGKLRCEADIAKAGQWVIDKSFTNTWLRLSGSGTTYGIAFNNPSHFYMYTLSGGFSFNFYRTDIPEAETEKIFKKYDTTDKEVIEKGTYVIAYVSQSKAMDNSNDGSTITGKNITISDDTIKTSDKTIMWEVVPTADNKAFYLKNLAENKYLFGTNSTTNLNNSSISFVDESFATKWTNYIKKYGVLRSELDGSYFGGAYSYSSAQYLFGANSMYGYLNSMTFYKLEESGSSTTTPPPSPPAPTVPDTKPDEPEVTKDDFKIHNTASVSVGGDARQRTETMENPMAGELILEKRLYGSPSSADRPEKFSFTVELKLPGGVKFEPDKISVILNGQSQQLDWNSEGDTGTVTFDLGLGDNIRFTGVPFGTKYTIKEEGAEHYTLKQVTINKELVSDEELFDGKVSGEIESNPSTTEVVYYNRSKYVALPETGSTGTKLFYLFGSLLFTGSLLWLMLDKKDKQQKMPQVN